MTRYKPIERNGRHGMHYLFENCGECIPMHKHKDAALTHTVSCLSGYVHVFGPMVSQIVTAGNELHFDSSQDHEIEALADETEIINYYLHGRPPGHENIPPAQLAGTCQFKRTQHYQ